jgi:GNAT superfamily N-acetyltransferase
MMSDQIYGMAVTPVMIRPGVPGDRDALRDVFGRASLSNAGDRAALLANPQVLQWVGESLAEGRTRVAAEEDGTVVGFATTLRIGTALELEDLFVDPRRMRQGVGRRLIEDALRSALVVGADRVQVVANPHAMAFYESVGFIHDGVAQTRFGPAPRMRLDVVCPPPPPSRTSE